MELRRRFVPPPVVEAFVSGVSAVDLFPKHKEDFRRVQTPVGAAISVATVVLIGLFVIWELLAYLTGRDAYRTELSIDTNNKIVAPFNFDITFPRIPCHELSVDVMDVSGGQDSNVMHDLFKSPVNRDGELVFVGKFNYVERKLGPDGLEVNVSAYDETRDPKSPKFCGNCYITPGRHHGYDRPGGAVDHHYNDFHKGTCCNTCDSVMAMYDMHRVPRPERSEVEQCIHELSTTHPGCNIVGTLVVRKVRGNFHFAPGLGLPMGPFGQHIHQYDFEQVLKFNVTHIINHLSVGDRRVQGFYNIFPLDRSSYTSFGLSSVRYFVNVVPATYRVGSSEPQATYEFSAQRSVHTLDTMQVIGMAPSLFFMFEFHPIQMNHIFERPSVSHLLVQICCIVGGMFVILGLVDRTTTWAAQNWKK